MVFLLSLFAIIMLRRDFEFQTHKSEPFVVRNTKKIGFLAKKNIQTPQNRVGFFAMKKQKVSFLQKN